MTRRRLDGFRVVVSAFVGVVWSTLQLVLEGRTTVTPLVPATLDLATKLLPVTWLGWLLGRAESATKPVGLLLAVVLWSGLTAILGILLAALPGRWRYGGLVAVGFGVWCGGSVLSRWRGELLWEAGVLNGLLAAGLIAGLALVSSGWTISYSPSRRRFARGMVLGLGALALLYAGRRGLSLLARSKPPRVVDERGLPPALTPLADFYVVSKNVSDPVVDAAEWRLRITGKVIRPLDLDLVALRERTPVRLVSTLECISNDVAGPYISTGEWVGVRLRDLLEEARPLDTVVDVVLRAADGYSDSIPLSVAMRPEVILAYGLNGQTLPPEHGFPLRLVVPGIYGMKNVKWITDIELVDYDFRGYWQERGWSDSAIVQIHSRIDVPRKGATLRVGDEVFIGGIAFAGDRGISRVEYSIDGGKTWTEAELEPPLSALTWVRWWSIWRPVREGSYELVVRAWDGQGMLQDGRARPPLPEGATGWHRVLVHVRES